MSKSFEICSSDDAPFNLICDHVVDLAVSLNARAIFTVGDICLDKSGLKGIPVLPINSVLSSVFGRLKAAGSESLIVEQYADAVSSSVEESTSLIQSAAALEYMLGNISDGFIIGIMKTASSCSIVIHDISENKMVRLFKEFESRVSSDVLHSVMEISMRIATQGREGKNIGTAFIIGDEEEVMQRSHQMILNPYQSQEKDDCSILNKHNWESVLEFSQLDGVFIVSGDGTILSAGRYLDVDAHDLSIGKGLGSRHISAASITRDTNAISVIVSQSGGIIRCYMDGKEIFSIDPFLSNVSTDFIS